MQAFRIDGYSVLITGAGSGMGRATAVLAARAGATRLALCGRRREPLDETAALVKEAAKDAQVDVLTVDVGSAESRDELVRGLKSQWQSLDLLVNNAGLFAGGPIAETGDDAWRQTMEVNVTAPFALTRDFLPLLARSRHASVVNISSTLAVKPIPGASAYNTSKAALLQMTRSLALELGPKGVRVNGIMPAVVDTPMYRGRYDSDAAYAKGLVEAGSLHPIGRVGSPDDIAYAVLYLASPAASWVTGVNLPVDGSMLCT